MTSNGERRDEVAGKFEGPPTDDELRLVEHYADAIDAYVEGTLEPSARRELERAAANDPHLRAALDDAAFSARLFGAAPVLHASDALTARILDLVDAEETAASSTLSRRSPAPVARRRRGVLAALAAVAAAVVLMVVARPSLFSSAPATSESLFVAADGSTYTEAEVRAAAEQVEVAMAVFGRTLDATADAVRSDMTDQLRTLVNEPLREGLGHSVNRIPYLRPRGGEQEHSGIHPAPDDDERPLRSRSLESAHTGERT